jgi:hypothetical protein
MPMARSDRLGLLAACLLAGFCAACASVDEPCRVAYDLGSSGIRAGTADRTGDYSVKLDSLAILDERGVPALGGPTIAALRDIEAQGRFAQECRRVGAGFSVWRLALERDRSALVGVLEAIEASTGVAVLVLPQRDEGHDAYLGARRLLGGALSTSHILDIGGGSLQIAGEHDSAGAALGQKIWYRELCRRLRNVDATTCPLQPMSAAELATARAHLADLLKPHLAGLARNISLTAISRPVTRGVKPAVDRLVPAVRDAAPLERTRLSVAIGKVATMSTAETAAGLDTAPSFAQYLLSDMLLVEGILQGIGLESLNIAEAPAANVQGLLQDDRAFAWQRHYQCYLAHLKQSGIAAYGLDPGQCPAAARPGP